MKLDEKTIEKKYIYKGRIINVRTDTAELPNGKQALREASKNILYTVVNSNAMNGKPPTVRVTYK